MKIIAGKYRGRKIETVNSKNLRPTTSFTREAIFNILMHGNFAQKSGSILKDAVVLDLFCGSGAFAMESLSRGAAKVILADVRQKHLDLARKNIDHINELENASFLKADCTNLPMAHIACDIIFMDPPYDENVAFESLETLNKHGWLNNNSLIILETSFKQDIKLPDNMYLEDDRKYGASRIRFIKIKE